MCSILSFCFVFFSTRYTCKHCKLLDPRDLESVQQRHWGEGLSWNWLLSVWWKHTHKKSFGTNKSSTIMTNWSSHTLDCSYFLLFFCLLHNSWLSRSFEKCPTPYDTRKWGHVYLLHALVKDSQELRKLLPWYSDRVLLTLYCMIFSTTCFPVGVNFMSDVFFKIFFSCRSYRRHSAPCHACESWMLGECFC